MTNSMADQNAARLLAAIDCETAGFRIKSGMVGKGEKDCFVAWLLAKTRG